LPVIQVAFRTLFRLTFCMIYCLNPSDLSDATALNICITIPLFVPNNIPVSFAHNCTLETIPVDISVLLFNLNISQIYFQFQLYVKYNSATVKNYLLYNFSLFPFSFIFYCVPAACVYLHKYSNTVHSTLSNTDHSNYFSRHTNTAKLFLNLKRKLQYSQIYSSIVCNLVVQVTNKRTDKKNISEVFPIPATLIRYSHPTYVHMYSVHTYVYRFFASAQWVKSSQ